jgi:hypothetical protein
MGMSKLTHYVSFPGRVSDDLVLITKPRGEGSEWHMAMYINTNENFNITSTLPYLIPFIAKTKRILHWLSFAKLLTKFTYGSGRFIVTCIIVVNNASS